ncbi:MAG TPA: alkaline phosphatase family protein [Polyangia bacterium]|nr:alkaline phosphatase family protein [Polyangia bacterium]
MIVQSIERRSRWFVAGLSLLGLLGACVNNSGNTTNQCRALTATTAQRPSGWTGTVFTIVMENHSQSSIIGNKDAPYINQLATQYAVADGYHDSYVHPSEPNYIWMVAGENFGILDDNDPGPTQTIDSTSHLVDQLEKAGLSWRAYQESMGTPCNLRSSGLYATKHDPFVYFSDVNGWNGTSFQPSARCQEHVVDYSQLATDITAGALPSYVFITPNLNDDMHDGTVAQGDAWLAREVPKILATDAYKNGGVLFLTWDEGSNQSDDPPFIAIAPTAKPGFVSHVDYDTSSFLKTVQTMLGVEALPCSTAPDAVPTMSDLFTTPL